MFHVHKQSYSGAHDKFLCNGQIIAFTASCFRSKLHLDAIWNIHVWNWWKSWTCFLLTHGGWDKMAMILVEGILKHFCQWKCLNFDYDLLEIDNTPTLVQIINGLVANRQQGIIGIYDDLVYWCIYAWLSLNEWTILIWLTTNQHWFR